MNADLRTALLTSDAFAPFRSDFSAEYLYESFLEHSPEALCAALDSMAEEGLLNAKGVGRRPTTYEATSRGWLAREQTLADLNRRHPLLLSQAKPLRLLVMAVLMSRKIEHDRIPPGFVWAPAIMRLPEVKLYLRFWEPVEIEAALSSLLKDGLAHESEPWVVGSEQIRTFGLTALGIRNYLTEVDHELKLNGGAILDLVSRSSINIFFSWQSDLALTRGHLTEALKGLVKVARAEWNPTYPLAVQSAVELGEGAARIDLRLFEKLANCDFAVFDVTPTHGVFGRNCPNPNVLIELGFALAHKKPERLVLVEYTDPAQAGAIGLLEGGNLPFDIAHLHRIRYCKLEHLRQRVNAEVREMLTAAGFLRRHIIHN